MNMKFFLLFEHIRNNKRNDTNITRTDEAIVSSSKNNLEQVSFYDIELSKIVYYAYHMITANANANKQDLDIASWIPIKLVNVEDEKSYLIDAYTDVCDRNQILEDSLPHILPQCLQDKVAANGLKLKPKISVVNSHYLSIISDSNAGYIRYVSSG